MGQAKKRLAEVVATRPAKSATGQVFDQQGERLALIGRSFFGTAAASSAESIRLSSLSFSANEPVCPVVCG